MSSDKYDTGKASRQYVHGNVFSSYLSEKMSFGTVNIKTSSALLELNL